MDTISTLLWAAGVWLATTLVSVILAGVVVVSLPPDYFVDEAPPERAGTAGAWRRTRRIARNVGGVVVIALGLVLSVPGVPGQGLVTVLAGLLLVDLPGRHRLVRWLVRRRGVLSTLNRVRARLGRPALLPPGPPERSAPRR
jgi:hypothetical protein